MASRQVELEGHIIDSGMMGTCFGIIMDMGGSFEVEEFRIGRHETEESYARLVVEADDPDHLQSIIHELHQNGANPSDPEDAHLEPAPADQVVPKGFYSTTNHPTDIRVDGEWIPVENIEMDCAVIVERMRLLEGSSIDWLGQADAEAADIVYLDPMFPHRDKSALVKKEMQVFRTIVGDDEDSGQLLAGALEHARYRGLPVNVEVSKPSEDVHARPAVKARAGGNSKSGKRKRKGGKKK